MVCVVGGRGGWQRHAPKNRSHLSETNVAFCHEVEYSVEKDTAQHCRAVDVPELNSTRRQHCRAKEQTKDQRSSQVCLCHHSVLALREWVQYRLCLGLDLIKVDPQLFKPACVSEASVPRPISAGTVTVPTSHALQATQVKPSQAPDSLHPQLRVHCAEDRVAGPGQGGRSRTGWQVEDALTGVVLETLRMTRSWRSHCWSL